MRLFGVPDNEEVNSIRDVLLQSLNTTEVIRNFSLGLRTNVILSIILFLPWLIFLIVINLISLVLDSDDPELLLSWPEMLRRYNKYVLAITSERLLIIRLRRFWLFGYRLGKQVSLDLSDVARVDFQLYSNIGQLDIKGITKRYRYKIKGEFWITRSRQIYQLISSMKYF
jgi:hypothetical protein